MVSLSRCINENEYTEKEISDEFGALGAEEIKQLRQFPSIFAFERKNEIDPHFGQIVDVTVRRSQGQVRIDYNLIPLKSFLTYAQLEEMKFELDIENYEMNRSHWAVKNVNLAAELKRKDITLPSWAFRTNPRVDLETHEFDVALSFPGSARERVECILGHLENQLGPDRYFYDKNYEAQLSRPSLDTLLQGIYQRSKLIVVFIGADYQNSEWCGIEFRAVRGIINNQENNRIMLIRLDDGEVDGIFSHDGYLDARQYSDEEIANSVNERYQVL